MLKLMLTLLTLSGSLSAYGGAVSQVASELPPRPGQSMIECHDVAWVADNLTDAGSFKLQKKFAPFVERAITDSKTNYYQLQISSSYRTCPEQKQLRISACGLGDYNLNIKPIDLCFPPTEPAGKSLHNEGLAVDFKCSGYGVFDSSPCLLWLRKNGYKYHLYEHRLEPWHWSTTGQ